MYLADTEADQAVAAERQKKIAWCTSIGSKPVSDEQREKLLAAREHDRKMSSELRGQDDANRRVPALMPHAAPLQWNLKSAKLAAHAAAQAASSSSSKRQSLLDETVTLESTTNVAAKKHKDANNLSGDQHQQQQQKEEETTTTIYPPPPNSTYEPHSKDSSFRWKPSASDFFPNTKTMIESRKGTLQQFRQLCYFTLLKKRVEGRLDLLQRERAAELKKRQQVLLQQQQQQQQKEKQQKEKTSSSSSAPTSPISSSSSSSSSGGVSLEERNNLVFLGGLFDPLPDVASVGSYALSKEMKTQVERKLNEAALRIENVNAALAAAVSSGLQHNNASSSSSTATPSSSSSKKESSKRSSSKNKEGSGSGAGRSSSSDHNKKSHQHQQQQHHHSKSTLGDDDEKGGDSKSARFASSPFSNVSSNLQLMTPVKIDDLEVHPAITSREPFAFKSQRFPRLSFPKHDYCVSGPQNALLNFPAGNQEVAETPITESSALVSASSSGSTTTSAGEKQQQQQKSARGAGGGGKSSALPVSSSARSATSATTTSVLQPQQKDSVAERFVLPQVSVETFEMPIVAHNKFRAPLTVGSTGSSAIMSCKDFADDFFTAVPSAPLQSARPSPCPNRHQPLLQAPSIGLIFSSLPKTLAEPDPEDDLSDDEEHDLVDAGDTYAQTESSSGDSEAGGGGEMRDTPILLDQANSSRPGTGSGAGETKRKSIGAQQNQQQQNQQQQQQPPFSNPKTAAQYLSTPPLTLDDALKSLNLLVARPMSATSSTSKEDQQQQQQQVHSPSKRPSTPTRGGGGASSPTMTKQQAQALAEKEKELERQAKNLEKEGKTKSAKERLKWTAQPVHSEDAFDVNEKVEASLKEAGEGNEKRKKMLPNFLQHLA